MDLGTVFYVLMLLWLVLGGIQHAPGARADWRPAGSFLLLFTLFLCLGWKTFGPPIQ